MNKEISYDKKHDILAIHKGFRNGEKFKGNIDIGNLILDVSTKGRIVGIEILNVSKFLKDFKIKQGVLNEMKDADFNATMKHNNIMINLILKSKDQEIPAKIAVPLETISGV